jgi:hypothetical protein
MTDYFLRLKNIDVDGDGADDELEYHFNLVQNLDDNGEIPFSVIEADQSLNNQALGFSGKTRTIPLKWVLYDDGTDKANGTVPSGLDNRLSNDTVVTVEEQIIYLRRYFQNSTLGARWRFFGGSYTDPDGDGTDEGTPAAVQTVSLARTAGNPESARGQVRIKVANVV